MLGLLSMHLQTLTQLHAKVSLNRQPIWQPGISCKALDLCADDQEFMVFNKVILRPFQTFLIALMGPTKNLSTTLIWYLRTSTDFLTIVNKLL